MMYAPDYNDFYDMFEAEQERLERCRKNEEIEEELEPEDMPFWEDIQTIIELIGGKAWANCMN